MSIWSWLVVSGWVVFCGYWLLSAARIESKSNAAGSYRSAGVRLGLVVIVLGAYSVIHRNQPPLQNTLALALGMFVFVLGLALAVWARILLGSSWGMPRTERSETALVTAGPYRWIRHPIYTGLLMGFVGSALTVNPWWFAVFVLMGAYFFYSARVEERHMVATFPRVYSDYQKKTRMVIPFVI
jgi:protein-S-isoprenylcysteine O-methyltransferase Ste14